MKKITLFAAALALVSVFTGCGGSADKSASAETDTITLPTDTVTAIEASKGVVDLKDDAKFRPGQNVEKVTVLDFNATWCIPCKKLTPAYHKVAETAPEIEFYSVDIDSLPETKAAFEIESVPTVVILTPDGKQQKLQGLDPFTKGAKDLSGDSLTTVIAASLIEIIENTAKAQ